jgi:predicted transglutaminase-like cysteine proteinase
MARTKNNKKRLGAISVILAISASAASAATPVARFPIADPMAGTAAAMQVAANALPGALGPVLSLAGEAFTSPSFANALQQMRTSVSLAIANPVTRGTTSITAQTAPVTTASIATAALTTASLKPSASPRPATDTAAPDGAVFDTVAIPFKRLAALAKFAPSLAEMNSGKAFACKASGCTAAFQAVHLASADAEKGNASIRDRLNAVNAAVNGAIRYSSDKDTYNQEDHWATPSETLAMQKGDCEDFAILKMAALRAEGFDPSQMSIVVLFDQKRHFYHAVLSVAVGGHYFILDNMRNQVLLDTQLPDYRPLYSIRDGKGYLHGSRRKDQNLAMSVSLEKVAPGEGVAF